MKHLKSLNAFLLLLLLPNSPVLAVKYQLSESITGSKFYESFNFETITDPVHGRVNYVDQATAQKLNLTSSVDAHVASSFVMRADSTNILDPAGPGRNALRIRSKKSWTTHVTIFDIRHMPEGCGTWPAVREKSPASNPNGGLIDVIEGVNDLAPNLITLHTTAGCTVPANRTQSGTVVSLDCNAGSGCGVNVNPADVGYGPGFNQRGGGWYAVERTPEFIKIWFWSRKDWRAPYEVQLGAVVREVNTDTWGTPVAFFPNSDQCNLEKNFSEHNILLSLTLCGDWAGSAAAYPSTCPATCVDNVNNNPSAFKNAYFDFGGIHVFANP